MGPIVTFRLEFRFSRHQTDERSLIGGSQERSVGDAFIEYTGVGEGQLIGYRPSASNDVADLAVLHPDRVPEGVDLAGSIGGGNLSGAGSVGVPHHLLQCPG